MQIVKKVIVHNVRRPDTTVLPPLHEILVATALFVAVAGVFVR